MSLIAGIFCFGRPVPSADVRALELRRKMSRHPSDLIVQGGDAHAMIMKVDVGAFGSPGVVEDESGVTMVAGEPLVLAVASGARSRIDDARALHGAMLEGDYAALRGARGSFACAHYSREARRLVLMTDKVGIRPIYYWATGDIVVFSSTLRLLELLSFVEKRPCLRGIAEHVAFGFALGARTPYEGISLLKPGEVLSFDVTGAQSQEYWKWQDIRTSTDGLEVLTDRAYAAFMDAVRVRQRDDRYATAFLSGGLDSRCVVAALRAEGSAVHSFNFARPESEDRVFGAELARVAGTVHEEYEVDDEIDVRWSSMIANARAGSKSPIKSLVERPKLIWSGDGGSVGLGHVYVRPNIAQLCQQGDLEGAAMAYVEAERAFLPRRLLTSQAAAHMLDAPLIGVVEELKRLRTTDLLQTFYLMLLHNDQHRHLFHHFEELDLHRIELQLPFFDADFLAVINAIPIEQRLYHRFYNQWLERFPAYVAATYWQAYPGHEPCPIPRPGNLAYQWDSRVNAAKRRRARRRSVRMGMRTLLSSKFARDIMRRDILTMATLLQCSGVREMDHIIYAARSIQAFRDATRDDRT